VPPLSSDVVLATVMSSCLCKMSLGAIISFSELSSGKYLVKLQHFHDYDGQWISIKTESDAELRKGVYQGVIT
jgi:hypothetical protein